MAEVVVQAEVVVGAEANALAAAVAMLLKQELLLRKIKLVLVKSTAHLMSLENLINAL